MVPKKLETISYAAQQLNITKARVYEVIRQGLLGGVVRLGRQIRIDPDELEKFIKKGGQALPGVWKKNKSA